MEEIVVVEDKEEHFDVRFDDFQKRKVQESVDIDNNKFQQRVYQSEDKLNEEVKEMRKLMVDMSHKRHIEGTQTVNRRVLITAQIFISKADEVLQRKIWDPGGLRITVT